MKELKIKGEAVCRPVDRRDGGAVVENVVNMRPKGGDGGLVTVGRPMLYRRLAGCRPLCRFRRQDDSLLLASTGTTLVTAVERVEDAPTGVYPSSLPGEALCAVQRSAGNAIVMTSGGAVSAGLNTAGLATIPLDMEIPAISLMARTSTPVAASVAPRTLSKDYGGAVRLTKRDADDVAADLSSAYLDMCADAATVGAFIQPALCRYRLRDRSGNIVYISPVVLLSHPTGAQCASPVAITSADRRNIDGYVVEADTWQLEVSIPEWRVSRADEIAALEIYMSPQFHPYNPDMRAYTSLSRGAGSSSPFIYVALPGRNCGLGDDAGGSAQKTIMRAIARIDDLEERVAVISNPFSGDARKVSLSLTAAADVANESKSLQAALRKAVKRTPRLKALLNLPHAFSAKRVAADASVTAWADLSVHRYEGYPLSTFAAATVAAPWTAVTVVKFNNNKGVVRKEEHGTDMPITLSPVLSYPSADATEMTITYSGNGQSYSRTFQLSPDESGRCAVYVADTIKPISMPSGAVASTGDIKDADEHYADAVAFAPADNPLAVDAVVVLGGGTVMSIVSRAGSDQSWEFGRSRFIAGAEGGIYSIGVGVGRMSISTRQLSPSGVKRSDALAPGEGGEVFALCGDSTSSGPELVRISASGRVSLFSEPRNYKALAYNHVSGELWALRGDGSADIFCRDYAWRRFQRTDAAFETIVYAGGTPYAVGDTGVAAICRELGRESNDVELSISVSTAALRRFMPRLMFANVVGERIAGSLSVDGVDIAGNRPWPITECSLTGSCRSPLSLHLWTRPVHKVRLRLEASVSADFVFDSFKLCYD